MALKLKPLRRKAASQRLEHQRLTSLINSMADAVLAVDEKQRVVLYNAAALNLFDINTIRPGAPLSSLCKLTDKNNQPVDIAKMVNDTDRPTAHRDFLLAYHDGSISNLYLSIAPVRLGYGERGPSGHVLLARDITREKSLEEERDEFISVISHELRTPIAIAEGNISNAQLLAEKAKDGDSIQKALKEAHTQVLFLADMINDLSMLSRAERGKLQLEIKAIDVNKFMNELAAGYTSQAAAKGLQLNNHAAPKLPALRSSELYVREILQNFITNAIKYTEHGHIELEAKADPKGIRFMVRDTGIGISKADQERVFDKFFRSEDFRTRQSNGTGLGLYVTMKLARLVHADIELESQLNVGSTFSIFIPNLE